MDVIVPVPVGALSIVIAGVLAIALVRLLENLKGLL